MKTDRFNTAFDERLDRIQRPAVVSEPVFAVRPTKVFAFGKGVFKFAKASRVFNNFEASDLGVSEGE